MLSHRNITSFLSALHNHDIKFLDTDVYLSFLPMPHVFERVVIAGLVCYGSNIMYLFFYLRFYAGDMLKLKDDCKLVRPTIFIAVPRIFNRIVDKIQDQFK